MPELLTEATEDEAQTLPIGETDENEYDEAIEDLAENIRNGGLFGASDDGGEIELDEATLMDKARQLDQIQIAASEVEKARDAYESAKRIATSRKAEWEGSVERLTDLIKASRESMPLFDRKPDAPYVAVDSDLNGAEGVQLASVPGFPGGVVKALEEQAEVTTVGQLATFTKTKDLTLLKGVGQAKADASADAMEAFWDDWNAKYPPKSD